MAASSEALLEVRDLVVEYQTPKGPLRVLDGVSLDLHRGEALGVLGGSGSGKSTLALAILRLLPGPQGRIVSGQVIFEGQDLLSVDASRLRQVRGRRIAMVFQEPASALNPVIPVGEQVAEPMRLHLGLRRAEARRRVVELFDLVGIPAPEARYRTYPHELSGGMRQRVLLAAALACDPALLLADEPTTALDLPLQAQVLELLRQRQQGTRMALLLVTHDLGLLARVCDRAAVLYEGCFVEQGVLPDLLRAPRHPYTAALLHTLASLEQGRRPLVQRGTVS